MSSLNAVPPSGSVPAHELSAPADVPETELGALARALTRDSTTTAAGALLRHWVGAAQAELLWMPLPDDAMSAGSEPALVRLAQAAVVRDQLVSEPDAPGDTLPVWVGVAVPLHGDGGTIAVVACRVAAERWSHAACRERFERAAHLIEAHLAGLRALEELRGSVRRLE